MTRARKTALLAVLILVIGMIVRDPHQAHRPPDQRSPAGAVAVETQTA